MRLLIVAAALLAAPAFADVYSLSITMPNPGGNSVNCKPYVNGQGLAAKPCGATAQTYASAIPTEGSYTVEYSALTAKGTESGKSPAAAVVITEGPPPTPGAAPSITIVCPAGSSAVIKVNSVTVPCG